MKVDTKTREKENQAILEQIAWLRASFTPNPNCKREGCYGKKGYTGYNIETDAEGNQRVRLTVCCGDGRINGFSLVAERIRELERKREADMEDIRRLITYNTSQIALLKSQTFWGGFVALWNMIIRRLRRSK